MLETHIYANSIHSIEFMSTVAFRKPFTIPYKDMVEGPGAGSILFFDGIDKPDGGKTKAALLTLHALPGSETANNLIVVEPCLNLFEPGAKPRHIEFVSIELTKANGEEIILSQGVIVHTVRHADDYEFSVLFTDSITI
ncbi:hypothetical protein [Paraburkholderia nemoris]|uniref:hypothetical protein n=1 Tax=Paraburkholderia nemoris TaxID=2793076 RepID=UPI001B8D2F63|nr:hypothetical protein [Paraburkholderia nemoris]